MKYTISICGNIAKDDYEKIRKTLPEHYELNLIKNDDFVAFDEAIYTSHVLILRRPSFIYDDLAERRVLKPSLQKDRPVFVWCEEGDSLYNTLESLKGYRENLPDEKSPEAKDWFVYPKNKLEDFFKRVTLDELIEILPKLELSKIEINSRETSVPISEIKKLQDKFPKSKIYKSFEEYHAANENRKPGVFVATFATGNNYLNKLAELVGKIIAESDAEFINGGGDGGRDADGPMRSSALGAYKKAPVLFVYSLGILSKYVSTQSMNEFENVSIIPVVPEGIRKGIMISCKVVVALPGAIGTYSEVFDAIMKGKPVIFVDDKAINNGRGFWGPFLENLKQIGVFDRVSIVYNGENFESEFKKLLNSYLHPKEKVHVDEFKKIAPEENREDISLLASSLQEVFSAGVEKNPVSSQVSDPFKFRG